MTEKRSRVRLASFDRAPPVKAACQACRTRKQKCDGASPTCGRCVREQRVCYYVQSRRGLTYAHLHQSSRQTSQTLLHANAPVQDQESTAGNLVADLTNDSTQLFNIIDTSDAMQLALPCPVRRPEPTDDADLTLADQVSVSLFFVHFWPSHPFLPPQEIFQQLPAERVAHVISLVRYVSSLFARRSRDGSKPLPLPSLPDEMPRTVESVQALLLHAIVAHMHNQTERAHGSLHKAIDIALELGMQKLEFAPGLDKNNSVLEESWRRTWWELYILDTMLTALHNLKVPRIGYLWRDVLLPNEDMFFTAQAPSQQSCSMETFDGRVFADDDLKFSSFAYRIAAARAMCRMLQALEDQALGNIATTREAEFMLDNLILHMPDDKKSFARLDGTTDETIFQAQMLINAATIYLHRPQSDLATVEDRGPLLCVQSTQLTNTSTRQYHTKKCLDAASNISHMISVSSGIASHTPFFTCALAIQAVVQLAAYWRPDLSQHQTLMHQQVQLALGALKQLEKLWPMASVVLRQIKEVARAVLTRQRLYDELPQNDVVRAMLEEDISAASSASNIENFLVDHDGWLEQFMV